MLTMQIIYVLKGMLWLLYDDLQLDVAYNVKFLNVGYLWSQSC